MLNNEVAQQNFTKVWTNKLVLVDYLVNISFGTPANMVIQVECGLLISDVIKEAAYKSNVLAKHEDFMLVKQGNCVEIDMDKKVWEDINVILCHIVTVIGDI